MDDHAESEIFKAYLTANAKDDERTREFKKAIEVCEHRRKFNLKYGRVLEMIIYVIAVLVSSTLVTSARFPVWYEVFTASLAIFGMAFSLNRIIHEVLFNQTQQEYTNVLVEQSFLTLIDMEERMTSGQEVIEVVTKDDAGLLHARKIKVWVGDEK